jgi:hypothetical protein
MIYFSSIDGLSQETSIRCRLGLVSLGIFVRFQLSHPKAVGEMPRLTPFAYTGNISPVFVILSDEVI